MGLVIFILVIVSVLAWVFTRQIGPRPKSQKFFKKINYRGGE